MTLYQITVFARAFGFGVSGFARAVAFRLCMLGQPTGNTATNATVGLKVPGELGYPEP